MGSSMDTTPTMMKKLIHPRIKIPELTSLKKCARMMTTLQRSAFDRKYGKIIMLLGVDVQVGAISALSQFYDPSMRCFTFRDFQLAPTLEEYSQILGYSLDNVKPYLTMGQYYSQKIFATILGVKLEELQKEEKNRNGYNGFHQKYLEGRMEYLAGIKNWDSFRDVLAVTIYGIILFPHIEEFVDLAAIEVFLAFREKEKSPVPAILADTYLTLTHCTEKKGKNLVCCMSTLYVWLINHVFPSNYKMYCPIVDYQMCYVEVKNSHDWAKYLVNLNERKIRWSPRWLEREEVIYQCGNYPYVPLMGTRGCINYNPGVALRQLGYPILHAPDENVLTPLVIYGKGLENAETFKRIRQAWDKVIRKGPELLKRSSGSVSAYRTWLERRVQNMKFPFQALIVDPSHN